MSKKSSSKIQRIELSTYDEPLFCPFCGKRVVGEDPADGPDPCDHTLFIAHDEGFEFRSAWFDQHKGIAGVDSDELDLSGSNFDAYTDDVEIKNAVKFAIYVPAPSFMGFYCGFAAHLK